MKTEFEAKFYPITKEEARKRLQSNSATLLHPEVLMKLYLFGNTVNPNMKANYIRIRDEGDKITLAAKIHAREGEQLADQKEAEVNVTDLEETKMILEMAGLICNSLQEKKRETWELDNCEVTIDTWPGVETYVEVEGESEENVKAVADKLGFDWEQKIVTSVTEIYAQKYGLIFDEALIKIQRWVFED
jgi:adenylate cyclase class 2